MPKLCVMVCEVPELPFNPANSLAVILASAAVLKLDMFEDVMLIVVLVTLVT